MKISCDFENGLCGYSYSTNSSASSIRWIWHSGHTPSHGTGPSVDHTTNTAAGHYIYAEMTGAYAITGDTVDLITPWIKVGSTDTVYNLQFWEHMYGNSIGSLSVYREGRSGTKIQIMSLTRNSDKWQKQTFVFEKETEDFRVVFEATRGIDFDGDIAIDDIDIPLDTVVVQDECKMNDWSFVFTEVKVLHDVNTYGDCILACLGYKLCAGITYSGSGKTCQMKPVESIAVSYQSSGNSVTTLMSCVQGASYCKGGQYLKKYSGSTALGTECLLCTVGTFRTSGANVQKCEECLEGTFSDVEGSIDCKLCLPGSYSLISGAGNCTVCSAGLFKTDAGSGACSTCSPGTYSNRNGSVACESCSPGTYSNRNGSVACESCSPGTYSNRNGSVACESCSPGTYSNRNGSVACESCSPGTYSNRNGSVACESCSPGTYSDKNGSVACESCLPGTYSNRNGSVACESCSPGTYSDKNGSVACENCSPGTYSDRNGSVTCASLPVAVPLKTVDRWLVILIILLLIILAVFIVVIMAIVHDFRKGSLQKRLGGGLAWIKQVVGHREEMKKDEVALE